MKQISIIFRFVRLSEYYGTVLLITIFGFIMSANPNSIDALTLIAANMITTAFIFGFNDLEDAEDDKLDAKKRNRNTISGNQLSRRNAKIILILLFTIASFLYWQINFVTFVFGAIGLTLGWLYSLSIIRLKSIPVLDLLSHGYFFGLMYFITPIVAFSSNNYYLTAWYAVCIYLQSIMVDLNNEVRDLELDKKNKLRNTLIYFKLYGLEKYMVLLWGVVIGLFIIPAVIYKTSESLPIILVAFVSLILLFNLKDKFKSNRFSFPHQQRLLLGISIIALTFV